MLYSFNSSSSISFFKSFLFIIIITFLFFSSFNISLSSFVNFLLPSNIAISKSASSIICLLLSTPIFSTMSFVSLMPAVSIRFIVIPFIIMFPSIMSRVVPSMSVTIAFSVPISLFNKLLFPTFGFPIIPMFIPSLIIFPFSDSFKILFNSSFISFMLFFNSSLVIIIASSYSG